MQQLIIEPGNSLRDIKEYFNKEFNNLKIEFFKDDNKDMRLTADEMVKAGDMTLAEFSGRENGEALHIAPEMMVTEVEMMFYDVFKVHIQVFRKSGTVWLVTTNSDFYSLEDLNNFADEQQRMAHGDDEEFDDEEYDDD